MPGIAGIISERPPAQCERLVSSMIRSLSHQLPAHSGMLSVAQLGIYGGWTRLHSSPATARAFQNERRNISLIITGECFVDGAVRSELTRKRPDPQSIEGDWVIRLYEERGEKCFHELNGLFSGLLVDERRGSAFLFNDRYGLERLYFHEAQDGLYFASEAKALLCVLPQLRSFDPQGVDDFLTFGCTTDWRTLFRDVRVVPGASLWQCEHGRWSKGHYFQPSDWEAQRVLDIDAFNATLQDTFKRILPMYCESSLPVGIALTGGLDTRMLMACRPETVPPPVCYTFAGAEHDTIDVTLAARVARISGLSHSVIRIGPDFLHKFASYADKTIYLTDGCFGVTGAHEIYLNEHARQLAPVRLTGVFGSEILRNVATFTPLGLSPALLDPSVHQSVSTKSKSSANVTEHPVSAAAFKQIPWGVFGSLAACRSQVTFRTPYLDNELVKLAFTGPRGTRQSTASAWRVISDNNVSLSTVPTDRGLGYPGGTLRSAMRRMTSEVGFKLDYLCNDGRPHRLANFDDVADCIPRRGLLFGRHRYLQYRHWFRRELAEYVTDGVAAARHMPLWNLGFLKTLAASHIEGRYNYVQEINAVLTLEAVDRLFVRNSHAPTERVLPMSEQPSCERLLRP